MAYLEPKLVTKLAQKQVLTPGLVQMVSLLTLNKLELTEMVQQELVQNPVLEEGTEIVESTTPEIELDQDGKEQPAEGWCLRRRKNNCLRPYWLGRSYCSARFPAWQWPVAAGPPKKPDTARSRASHPR